MYIVVSDFSVSGSGYSRIMTRLCNQLVLNHDLGIIALGLGYNGEEHHWPYSIVPVPHTSHIPPMIDRLQAYGAPIEAIFVALDIPLQEGMLNALQIPGKIPYVGLFPLEAPPLCQPWAIQLMRMDARLIMSAFGQEELQRAGVASEFVPIGIDDPNRWRPPGSEERKLIRQGLGIEDDTFVILTIADNQERKNLSRAAEIVSAFSVEIEETAPNGFVTRVTEKRKVAWYLVTNVGSPVGWRLDDLAMRLGIKDRLNLFNRGMPDDKLWALYAAADAFLLPSKAEGLALPVLEAMACRVPVVGTNCTAIQEHLRRRGWPIKPEYQYRDSFGNGWRYWASVKDGVKQLEAIADQRGGSAFEKRIDRAEEYVKGRTWDLAAEIVARLLTRVAIEKGTRVDGAAEAAGIFG